MKIEVANLHHIPELKKLINSAYRGDHSKQGWTTEADLVDGLRIVEEELNELIHKNGSRILVLFDDNNKLIGSIHTQHENDETLYFGMLAVEPTLQGQGIGKKLIQAVIELANDLKCKEIRILVIQLRSELIAYYERLGFKKSGKKEDFPLPHLTKVPNIYLIEMIKSL